MKPNRACDFLIRLQSESRIENDDEGSQSAVLEIKPGEVIDGYPFKQKIGRNHRITVLFEIALSAMRSLTDSCALTILPLRRLGHCDMFVSRSLRSSGSGDCPRGELGSSLLDSILSSLVGVCMTATIPTGAV